MIKDSKTYTVLGIQLKDDEIDKNYRGKIDIIKKKLEDTFDQIRKTANLKHGGNMTLKTNLNNGRKAIITKQSDDRDFTFDVVDKRNDPSELTQDDIIALYERRSRIEWQSEFYKEEQALTNGDKTNSRDNRTKSLTEVKLDERIQKARQSAARDNDSLPDGNRKDIKYGRY